MPNCNFQLQIDLSRPPERVMKNWIDHSVVWRCRAKVYSIFRRQTNSEESRRSMRKSVFFNICFKIVDIISIPFYLCTKFRRKIEFRFPNSHLKINSIVLKPQFEIILKWSEDSKFQPDFTICLKSDSAILAFIHRNKAFVRWLWPRIHFRVFEYRSLVVCGSKCLWEIMHTNNVACAHSNFTCKNCI